MNAYHNYHERARQLLLNPQQTAAYITLNDYADINNSCPSCGAAVSGYESDRLTHARTCKALQADVLSEREEG